MLVGLIYNESSNQLTLKGFKMFELTIIKENGNFMVFLLHII